jgi:hypothetical protein
MSTQIVVTGVTFGDGTTQNTASTSSLTANNSVMEMNNTISSNYTMTAGKNGITAGPITINTGVTVTIPTGSTWTVV